MLSPDPRAKATFVSTAAATAAGPCSSEGSGPARIVGAAPRLVDEGADVRRGR